MIRVFHLFTVDTLHNPWGAPGPMAMAVACFLSMQLPRGTCGGLVGGQSCRATGREGNMWPSDHLCSSRNNNRHQTPMHLHQRCGAMLQTSSRSVDSTGVQGDLFSCGVFGWASWVLLSQLDTSSRPCRVNKPLPTPAHTTWQLGQSTPGMSANRSGMDERRDIG